MRAISAVAVILSTLSLFSADKKAVLSSTPLSSDQIAVYRAFLSSYDNGSKTKLNLSNRTAAIDFSDLKPGEGCLKQITLDQSAGQQIHTFNSEFGEFKNLILVDPEKQEKRIRENDPGALIQKGVNVQDAVTAGFAAGLLTLSEVVFDKTGQYAVLTFSFHCGALCGNGGTLVFEKTSDGKWQKTKRQCSSWMS